MLASVCTLFLLVSENYLSRTNTILKHINYFFSNAELHANEKGS